MKLSNFFTLNVQDFLKGLVVAILGGVASIIQTTIEAGSLTFDWSQIGKIALLSGLAYLTKNIFSNNKGQILTKDVPKP